METLTILVIIVVVVALLFDFVNGWNDSANAIATIVGTRVLSPFPKKHFGGLLNATNKTITFECRRIAKLCPPWSSALLTRYSQYLSRPAFDHDFGARNSLQ